jgi:hypothetical protein
MLSQRGIDLDEIDSLNRTRKTTDGDFPFPMGFSLEVSRPSAD